MRGYFFALYMIKKMTKKFKQIINFARHNKTFIFFMCFAFSVWLIILFFSQDMFVDEKTHFRQIGRFLKGNFKILPKLTTIPGYHAVIAFFAHFFKHSSLTLIRFISFFIVQQFIIGSLLHKQKA